MCLGVRLSIRIRRFFLSSCDLVFLRIIHLLIFLLSDCLCLHVFEVRGKTRKETKTTYHLISSSVIALFFLINFWTHPPTDVQLVWVVFRFISFWFAILILLQHWVAVKQPPSSSNKCVRSTKTFLLLLLLSIYRFLCFQKSLLDDWKFSFFFFSFTFVVSTCWKCVREKGCWEENGFELAHKWILSGTYIFFTTFWK